MTDLLELSRPRPADTRRSDVAVWGATHLRVRDLDRALRFWRDLLGLQVRHATPQAVHLGVPDAELVVLHAGARRPVQRGHAGLYHVALHLPTAQDFTALLARLVSRRVDPHPTDHLLHWALYLGDVDGIGVELSFETADRFDHVAPGRRPVFVGTDGREHGAVEPLDVGPLVEAFGPLDTERPMPAGTRVGHNHLHVGDLAAGADFYERLGFVGNPPIMGMRDFNARGSFLHRLAINEWQGAGAPPSPGDAAGLEHLELAYADDEALDRALADLAAGGVATRPLEGEPARGAWVADPSGNALRLTGSVA